jgi:hypothetical protein
MLSNRSHGNPLLPLLSIFASTASLQAADFRLGIKTGVPLTRYFDTAGDYSAATRRYTVGLSAEWNPVNRAALELGVLYKRMGYVGIVSSFAPGSLSIFTTDAFDSKGNSWDFPLIVKYRFATSPGVYAGGGGTVRYIGPIRARGEHTVRDLGAPAGTPPRSEPIETTHPSDLRKRVYPGGTVVAGIEFRMGRFRAGPEFRYTRWTANLGNRLLRFAPNQAEMLVAVVF